MVQSNYYTKLEVEVNLMQVEISFVYSFFAKGKLEAYMIINSPFF